MRHRDSNRGGYLREHRGIISPPLGNVTREWGLVGRDFDVVSSLCRRSAERERIRLHA